VAQGFLVLDRNWRCRDGEIDLVCRRSHLLVFCEVKTRSSPAFGSPAEAVTPVKQRRLRRLALLWLQAQAPAFTRPGAVRFDVATILAGRIEVIEGAF
jgi:putative endonuclease